MGRPHAAKKIQKTRPPFVAGDILPYPMKT